MHNGTLYTSTHSNSNGEYALIGIPEGMYTMEIELNGYTMKPIGNEQNMGELNMMSKATLNVDFNMMTSN